MLAEQDTSDPALCQRAAHFPQSPTQRATQRHPYWPGELDIFDIFADDLTIVTREVLEPFAHGLTAGWQSVKEGGKSLQCRLFQLDRMYHLWYVFASGDFISIKDAVQLCTQHYAPFLQANQTAVAITACNKTVLGHLAIES